MTSHPTNNVPLLIFNSFPYDCAFKFWPDGNREPKFGLFEIDPLNNKLKEYQTSEGTAYYNVHLLERIGPFQMNGIDKCYNLSTLPNLRLDMRESHLVKISVDCKKKAILLIHIKFFQNFSVMFREGMTEIYGIEKVCFNNNYL